MADPNANGDVTETKTEPMEATEPKIESEDYKKLLAIGIEPKVAEGLDEVYQLGQVKHEELDERALDALKEFPVEGALEVIKEFQSSNLEHVSNKSAYLCGVMKTYRQKTKVTQPALSPKGPDDSKLKEILDRTGYSLDVTTGQRKYGGPPPNWEGPSPEIGCEIYVGKLPKEIFEDELVPLFEEHGKIWDLRLMMDPLTGLNKGYCFVNYCDKESAKYATERLNDFEIKPGKKLKVNISIPNRRLFVGSIPKTKSREEIQEEFTKITEGVQEVIVYANPDNPKQKNKGFAFIDYDSHKNANSARRRLMMGKITVWGIVPSVDWADPQDEPTDEIMSKVKVLYVRNLTGDITEEMIKEKFEPYGKIERVKKVKDYAFVHFEERDPAVQAMNDLNGQKMGTSESIMEISLAKPQSEAKQKEKRRRQEERMTWGFGGGFPPRGGMGGRGRGGRMGQGFGPYGDFGGYYDEMQYRGGYGEPYYDDYCNYGFDDYYNPNPRGRGMRGGRGMSGRGSRGSRGGFGGSRGGSSNGRGRGGGGGMGGTRGRGAPRGAATAGMAAVAGGAANVRGGKRKMDGPAQGQAKRRNTNEWGAQPIAQQPLDQQGFTGGEWFDDSYGGQQW